MLPSCQTEVGGHIVYIKGVPLVLLSGNPLGTDKTLYIKIPYQTIYKYCKTALDLQDNVYILL